MNRWHILILCFLLSINFIGRSRPVMAVHQVIRSVGTLEEIPEPPQDNLSPAVEQAMWEDIQHNLKTLRSAGLIETTAVQAVTYHFPLRVAPGLSDYNGYRVSAFSDHNPISGQVLDYNGGTRTYDGHRGTDYALWPFGWNKLDGGEMQVVAAAAGTIVSSANVDSTDHNCGVSSSDPWNYIALLHADGRMTIYGHMRYNSLTSKAVGQTVAQGEYLGTAASSGDSSGPHLHFEARSGSFTNAEWFDPYAGPKSQPLSSWASQRPYLDSAINKLSTHLSPPSSPDPCQPSILNLQDNFTTPGRIYLYAFYRDFQSVLPTQLKLYRPDGSLYNAWQYAPGGNSFASAWSQGWVVELAAGDPAGTWRFEAGYNGQVYETFFNLSAPPAVKINTPNGGEQWAHQVPYAVTWLDNFGGGVNIALYHNGSYSAAIAYNALNNGETLWAPDVAMPPGPGYTIRVSSVINPAVYDESDAPFSITSAPVLLARDDFVLTPMNTPITIFVLSNDDGPGSGLMTITAVGNPGNGKLTHDDATLVYTPDPGFLGSDSFTYTASTSTETSDATVTVRVVSEVFQLYLPVNLR
jgi:hypothetical protein